MLSIQEVFDRSCLGIIEQGGPGMSPEGGCVYYDPYRNVRCQIGQLIPVEKLEQLDARSWDAGSISGLLLYDNAPKDIKIALEKEGINTEDREMINFLAELQSGHDDAADTHRMDGGFFPEWYQTMEYIASRDNLSMEKVKRAMDEQRLL